eukprot:scaffold293606_cov28-Tisochrysis_lutea.AAC.2
MHSPVLSGGDSPFAPGARRSPVRLASHSFFLRRYLFTISHLPWVSNDLPTPTYPGICILSYATPFPRTRKISWRVVGANEGIDALAPLLAPCPARGGLFLLPFCLGV